MKTIYANPLVEVSVSDDGGIVRIRRTNAPSRDIQSADFEAFATAVAKLATEGVGVLVDTRDAPGRNDEQFERDIYPAFRAVIDRFARQALLVRTEIGKIHGQRLRRESGAHVDVFTDERAALHFLESPESKNRGPGG